MTHMTGKRGLRRSGPKASRLEPRVMFDGAAVVDAVAVAEPQAPVELVAPPAHEEPQADPAPAETAPDLAAGDRGQDLALAESQAKELIAAYLAGGEGLDRLFALFSGNQAEPSAEWTERAEELLARIEAGEIDVAVEFVPAQSMNGAYAAFAAQGPGGQPTVLISTGWWDAQTDPAARAEILVEEYGHAFDHLLNGGGDTSGDEGEAFAHAVVGNTLSALDMARIAAEDDSAVITIDGQEYAVERASYTFVNAYAVDTTRTEADKESNTHDFDYTTQLGVVRVSDDENSRYFSGNDVSAIGFNIGGTDYFGWISRPIKAQGQVRGFYFWTDADFVDLATAQADGNADGDRDVTDNSGFILVVDQAYFDGLRWTDQAQGIKNVGSSSDRVDSALNSLIQPNVAPTANHDTLTVAEDSGLTTGNVLTNDTDGNLDSLTVTGFSIGGTAGTLGTPFVISGVGTFTLSANGAFGFTPVANYSGNVPTVTYTVSDGSDTATATVSIIVTPVNDAPTSADGAATMREGASRLLGLSDFPFADIDGDAMAGVRIVSVPTGLEYWNGTTWQAVTAGQDVTAADINAGYLRLTPVGTDPVALQFQVSDGQLRSATQTLTVTIEADPAPSAGADPGPTAVEAGDGEPGRNATGDLLASAQGSGLAIATVGNTAVGTNTQVAGLYGTLTVSSDGTFTYAPANDNPVVDALNAGDTLTETFTYTVVDIRGRTATGTLTVTIDGTNDTPVASPDSAAIKELAAPVNGAYGTVAGNVLDNDTDVDNASLEVVIGAGDPLPAGESRVLTVTSPVTGGTYTVDQIGGSQWNSANGIPSGQGSAVRVLLNGNPLTTSDNTDFLAWREGSGQGYLVVNDPTVFLDYPLGTVFGVEGSTTTFSLTAIDTTVSSSTDITVTAGDVNNVAVGFTVTGTDIPDGVTVTAINGDTITLSSAVQITNRDLTFTDPASSVTLQPGEMLLQGTHGYLIIGSDGSYTYTLTSAALDAGDTATETFTYTVTDGSVTAQSTLTVRIDGTTNPAPPTDADESLSTGEDTPLTGNLLANGSATTIVGFTWGTEAGTVGQPLVEPGIGTLTINADGSFTFTPDADHHGPVPAVTYVASDGGAERVSSTLSITVTPQNDAPTSTNDEATTFRNTPAVLSVADFGAYDDVEGDALDQVRITTLPTAGTLELLVHGNWTPVTAGQDIAVAAIVAGSLRFVPEADTVEQNHATIGFRVFDGTDLSAATYTLTVHVVDAAAPDAHPPVNTVAGPYTLGNHETLSPTISVADVDGDLASVTLTVANGSLAVTAVGNGATGAGTATNPLVLTGSQADINTMLGSLVYTPALGFAGSETLRVHTVDDGDRSDTSIVSITVEADARPLTVSEPTVNEASPYMVFSVTGAAGQRVTLELASTGTGDGHATIGQDVLPLLEVFDGSAWQPYAGGGVLLPGPGSLLVRVAVLQDAQLEGAETLRLIARNGAGAASGGGVGSIVDDGTGDIFRASNTTGTPDALNAGEYLDDDRAVSVSSVSVNEASDFAVFTVTGNAGQVIRLSLHEGSATTADFGSGLEVWTGAAWAAYTPDSDITLAGGDLLVRTPIRQDTTFEGQESFFLGVRKMSDDAMVYGIGNIYDDGTGDIFIGDATTPLDADSAAYRDRADDDRSLAVSSPVVNEASDTAIFTLTGDSGQTVTLQLLDQTASLDLGQTLQVWDGLDWIAYDETAALPTFDAHGRIYVRVDIQAEQDDVREGPETFILRATLSGRTEPVDGVATIVDDGTGVIFENQTPTGPGLPPFREETGGLDDDRPSIGSVGSPTVTEGQAAVFTVTLSNQSAITETFALSLAGGTATLGDDLTSALTFSNGVTHNAATGLITVPAGVTSFTVTVPTVDDTLVEGTETFTLSVGAVTGTATVQDNDAAAIGQVGSPTVTEGQAAVFTVTLSNQSLQAETFALALAGGTAAQGDDFTAALTFSNGVTYDPATGLVTVPAGVTSFTVTVPTVDDTAVESAEAFTLTVGAATGSATIQDNDVAASEPPPVAAAPPPPPPPVVPVVVSVPAPPPPPADVAPALPEFDSTAFVIPEFSSAVIRTVTNGFPIRVEDVGGGRVVHELRVDKAIPDVLVPPDAQMLEYLVPVDAFVHTDADAQVELSALMLDGTDLPAWLSFDPVKGEFTGIPPQGLRGELLIRVIARDDAGRQAETIVRIRLGESTERSAAVLEGRSGLSSQFQAAGVFAWKAERDLLIEQARALAEVAEKVA